MVKTILKQKNKSRKKNKKQMGGDNTNIPTINDNMERIVNIFKKAFIIVNLYLLNKFENKLSNIANSYGINPNDTFEDQISKISQKIENLNDVLNTPEGQQALSNLKDLFNKITTEVVIPSSTQLAEELIESLQPIMIRGQHAVFALLSASPFFGALIDIPRFIFESLGVLEKSVTLVNNGLKIVNETFDKLEDNKTKVKEEVSIIYSLINNASEKLSSGLDIIENKVDNTFQMPKTDTFKPAIQPNNFEPAIQPNNFKPAMPPNNFKPAIQTNNFKPAMPPNNFKPAIQTGGGVKLLNTYRNQAKMVGGRIIKSQLEFLTPYANKSQNNTKHKIKHKHKTTLKKR
jgi:hypothetical protein